jgi:hypothetical protein
MQIVRDHAPAAAGSASARQADGVEGAAVLV